MSEWLTQAMSRAQSVNDWLAPKRSEALATLEQTRWPNRKTEAWKYTPLRAVESFQEANDISADLTATPIEGLNAIDLVFKNGQCDFDSASKLPEGLAIHLMADADASLQAEVLKKVSSIKPSRHFFGLVNDALSNNLIYIKVADGAQINQPIRILSLLSAHAEAHTRVFVDLGKGAKLTVLEQLTGDAESLNTGFVEYDLAEAARLEHYRFAMQTGQAISLGGSHFNLAESADLNSTIVGFGSRLSRLDMDVIHSGEKAFAKVNAFYLLDNSELFDLHSNVEHAVPNGTTEENVRIIAGGQSKAVFNGRINIHRYAQKTLAELNNRNLLMSNQAEVNTKPELEIYADDVRCAHGATVAEIDKKAMYYLQSRGVSKEQAQVMLSFGFINELIDQMPNPVLAEWLRPLVRDRFAQMKVK